MRAIGSKEPASARDDESPVLDDMLDRLYRHYTRHGGYARDCMVRECGDLYDRYQEHARGEPR